MRYNGNIARHAQLLAKKCGTRDPFEIAEHLGVEILKVGSLKQLKGFYRVIKRNRFIFLNAKNTPQMNRIVCAHELGHDQLHREFAASNTLQEFMLYDMNSIQEYEANVFAANLLLEDDAVLELIYDGYDIVQIASELQSDANLVALKVDGLIRKGYDLRCQEHFAKFLKQEWNMCGRYTGYVDECEELKTIYTEATRRYPGVKFHSGEIFPTNTVPLLTGQRNGLVPVPGTWGYQGYNGKGVIINARAETAGVKPTFADSLRCRRCVVPTTGYFEWSGEKRKFLFRQPNRTILYLAGLYREYADGVRFVILTTAANVSTADVHPRMPVVLGEDVLELWGYDAKFAEGYLRQAMPEMIQLEA